MKRLLVLLVILLILLAVSDRGSILKDFNINKYFPSGTSPLNIGDKQTLVYEESTITKVVEEALPSVVTIGIHITASNSNIFDDNPFFPFDPYRRRSNAKEDIDQNIGSGFIISNDGLIITNKHVVSETDAEYKVLTNDKKEYTVQKIYRDPLNDLAILKINASNLKPLKLGSSANLKLGQQAIAIGTPLGDFTNTVTSGIVSGLGRGITAGSPLEGYVEKLDNVIQTDAAINPGNSGGPLLNSAGQVIGINTAVAEEGQNIGFALPVDIVKDLINKFNQQGGSFERPFIGVRYKMIDKQTAILNDLVQGAYVIEIVDNSPAKKADIQEEDVITEIDGKKIEGTDDQQLAKTILDKKVGDTITVKVWRNKEILTKSVTLEAAK